MVIDWKCIRYAQKELCIRKKLSLEEFKKAWIKEFGPPQTPKDERFLESGGGIEDFYEDFLTSTAKDVWEYFKRIGEE